MLEPIPASAQYPLESLSQGGFLRKISTRLVENMILSPQAAAEDYMNTFTAYPTMPKSEAILDGIYLSPFPPLN
jgi:hypothetical protein